MIIIPIKRLPAQDFSIVLGGQITYIRLYQKVAPPFMISQALYCDVDVFNSQLVHGVICQNGNRIIRDRYFGFQGDLGFYDTSGKARDPYWTGLGTDFIMLWFTPEEVANATH